MLPDYLMISLKHVPHKIVDSNVESYFFLVPEGFDKQILTQEVLFLLPNLDSLLEAHKFYGRAGSSVFLSQDLNGVIKKLFFVGVGKLEKNNIIDGLEQFRDGLGNVISLIKQYQLHTAFLNLNLKPFLHFKTAQDLLQDFLVTLHLSTYEFVKFKNVDRAASWDTTIEIACSDLEKVNVNQIYKEALIIADAMNSAREVADMPPNIANPEYVNSYAMKIAKKCNLEFKSFGKNKAQELGMGGFLAVGSGSANEIKFFEMKYASPNPEAKTIVLIGKGVTFDSGGISLKPSASMSDMKYDMSGAATVVAVAQIISQLQANVNVVAMAPLVENLPGPSCYRQDDIITHMNGVTSEVKNTDAEGRLILADAICYAEKFYQPELIIDVATLTGACVVALGHFFTGLFSNDYKISEFLKKTGENVGDYVWPMPCSDRHAKGIESSVADVANIGASSFGGGAISAAMFLKKFVSQAKWVHLDIAGTEMGLPVKSYLGKGATGVGIRLLTKFIKEYF